MLVNSKNPPEEENFLLVKDPEDLPPGTQECLVKYDQYEDVTECSSLETNDMNYAVTRGKAYIVSFTLCPSILVLLHKTFGLDIFNLIVSKYIKLQSSNELIEMSSHVIDDIPSDLSVFKDLTHKILEYNIGETFRVPPYIYDHRYMNRYQYELNIAISLANLHEFLRDSTRRYKHEDD
jgi:hypothetical protein